MKSYKEIFLPIESNKALQDILIAIHNHFREAKDIEDKTLREIYKSILACPILKDKLVWFNAWLKRYTGKPALYFIKDCDKTTKRIIEIFGSEKDYDKYVSSLSVLATDYKVKKGGTGSPKAPLDYAVLITTDGSQECDIAMASEHAHDFFVYLNFGELTKIFTQENLNSDRQQIEKSFKKNHEMVNQTIIQILKKSYELIKKNDKINNIIDNLTAQLSSVWQYSWGGGQDLNRLINNREVYDSNNQPLTKEKHRENMIRLINYYFWVKLAYPEEWKVLLYLPGVIAKEFKGVPLGVNIGLKEMVPLEVLLFLKKAVLLFFTRASIDYFEEVARGETKKHGRRAAVAAIMGRNMSHNIGSHVLANVVKMESLDKDKAQNLFKFLQQRMDFVAQISTTSPLWTVDIKLKEVFDKFNEQKYLKDYIADFRDLKSDNIKNDPDSNDHNKEIAIPTGSIGCHAIYSILENIIRNAARHGMKEQKDLVFKIQIDGSHPRLYKLTITDNCKNGDKAGDLNEKLAEHIIDDTGQLKREAWGMKEKKILACYLRLIPPEEVDDKYDLYKNNREEDEEPPIIEVADDEDNLKYTFFLLKPKKTLVVTNNVQEKEEFKNAGIDFIAVNNFEKMDRKKIIHKFLVLDMNSISDPSWLTNNILNHINRLPFRILIFCNSTIPNNLPPNVVCCSFSLDEVCNLGTNEFYKKIWEEWINHFYKNRYQLVLRWEAPLANCLRNSTSFILVIKENENKIGRGASNWVLLDHKRNSDTSALYSKVACHIPFGSEEPLVAILKEIPQKPYLIYELIEMGITKVAIIDDRIWKARNKICPVGRARYEKEQSKRLLNLWERKGVFIKDSDSLVSNFENFVEGFPDKKYHFLIFHQGEVDEIKKRVKENEFKDLWNRLKSKVICTVIDTGRGAPKQASEDGLRWIPYSLLQKCVLEEAGDSLAKKRLLDYLISSRVEEEKSNE